MLNYEKTISKRENNFDFLRILATIAVIMIHINYMFFQFHWETPDLGSLYYVAESLINIITRFSVPVFVLLSGAFVLQNPKNKDFKYFYKKTGYKILLPFLGVVILGLYISEMNVVIAHKSLIGPIKGALAGSFFNLWYMYMLLGLYICVPVIIRIKEVLTVHQYKMVAIGMMLLAITSQATSHYKVAYSGGVIAAYLAYFIAGDILHHSLPKPSKNILFVGLMVILGLVGVTFIIRYMGFSYYLFNAYTNFFSPAIVLFSLILFYIFRGIHIPFSCNWLSQQTFYIYLFHTFVIEINKRFLLRYFPDNEIISIFLIGGITFGVSLMLAIGYNHLWRWLEEKYNAREIWYKLFDRISEKYFY